MKKLVLAFALFITVALASCGRKAPEAVETVTETETVDSIAADSVVVDSVVADSTLICQE